MTTPLGPGNHRTELAAFFAPDLDTIPAARTGGAGGGPTHPVCSDTDGEWLRGDVTEGSLTEVRTYSGGSVRLVTSLRDRSRRYVQWRVCQIGDVTEGSLTEVRTVEGVSDW